MHFFPLLSVLISLPCHAFRAYDGVQEETSQIPSKYVLANSKVVDLTGLFSGKTMTMDGVAYRCCKSDADGLGLLKAESSTSLINSCSSLAGFGFKSFTHFSPSKCLVSYSTLNRRWNLENSPVVGELVDLSVALMKGQAEVVLPNGKQMRCCTAKDAPSSVLVDISTKRNSLDGTALEGLQRFGSFNKKKCNGLLGSLLGNSYHSWDKWPNNRCFVMSQDIPSDILKQLKWDEEQQQQQQPQQQQPQQQEEPQPPPPQPQLLKQIWQLGVRVVSATTQQTISGAEVRILKEDGSELLKESSNDVGVATFTLQDVLKVRISVQAAGYLIVSRAYRWKHPNDGRSDCYGEEECFTQLALSPKFRS